MRVCESVSRVTGCIDVYVCVQGSDWVNRCVVWVCVCLFISLSLSLRVHLSTRKRQCVASGFKRQCVASGFNGKKT